MNETATLELTDLCTAGELAAEHPRVLNLWTVREQLRHRQKNGLAHACVRVGRRLLISRSRYRAWLTSRLGS